MGINSIPSGTRIGTSELLALPANDKFNLTTETPTLLEPIFFVGSATQSFGSSTTGTLTLPTNLVENDVVIVAVGCDNSLPSITSSGWTTITSASNSPAAGDTFYLLAYKRMGATPDASVSVSGVSVASNALAMCYRNVHTDIFDTTFVSTNGATGAPNPPAITTVTAGDMVVAFGFLDDDSVSAFTPPTGYANITGISTGAAGSAFATSAANKLIYLPSTVDPAAFTLTGGNDAWSAVTIALKPANKVSQLAYPYIVDGNYSNSSGSTSTLSFKGFIPDAGDILVAFAYNNGSNAPSATGFTALSTNGSGPGPYEALLYKVSDGTETAITFSNTTTAAYVAVRGVASVDSNSSITSSLSGAPDPGSTTVTLSNSLVISPAIVFSASAGSATFNSVPTGYTLATGDPVGTAYSGAFGACFIAYKYNVSSGTENPSAWSFTVGGTTTAYTCAMSLSKFSSPTVYTNLYDNTIITTPYTSINFAHSSSTFDSIMNTGDTKVWSILAANTSTSTAINTYVDGIKITEDDSVSIGDTTASYVRYTYKLIKTATGQFILLSDRRGFN